MPKRPLLLTILDGWGYRAETTNNAIALARKPVYDKLLREFPDTLIQASEHFVGLPDGQMGNSVAGQRQNSSESALRRGILCKNVLNPWRSRSRYVIPPMFECSGDFFESR